MFFENEKEMFEVYKTEATHSMLPLFELLQAEVNRLLPMRAWNIQWGLSN